MPKRPFDLERYPHTHYHNYDQNWIYKEIGILKAWLFSLTKLWAKLAEADAEKYAEILDEINRLIKKIQALIDLLTAAVKQLRDSFDAFATCLENLLSSIKDDIKDIEEHLKDIDDEIEDIEEHLEDIDEEIENIYDLIKQILSESYASKYLTYGTDYRFTFYNGYYCQKNYDENYIIKHDTIMDSGSERYHSVEYNITFGGYHQLRNDDIVSTSSSRYPEFSHGETNEKANIGRIIIDELKNMTIDSIDTSPGIWNVYPTSARASWEVITNASNAGNNEVDFWSQSIADGYNNQYLFYIESGAASELSFGTLAVNITIKAHYTEVIE